MLKLNTIKELKDHVVLIFRKFGRFFRRLYRWIPILYNDENWDYAYLLIIERQKLKDMIKCMEDYPISESDWRSVRYMKICVSLLDEMIGDVDRTDNYLNLQNWRIIEPRISKEGMKFYERLYSNRNLPDDDLIINGKSAGKIDNMHLFKCHIREEKVNKLYYKIRYYFTDNWWN